MTPRSSQDPQPDQDAALQRAEALRQLALRDLATNSAFMDIFVHGYLKENEANALAQLATVPVPDLPIARQRWLDAKALREDLLSDIDLILNPPIETPERMD